MDRQQLEKLKVEGEQLTRNKSWQEALEKFQQVFVEDPNDARTLRLLGELHVRLGNLESGKKYLKRLAELYTHNGWWSKAISANKLILKVDPEDREIQNTITELYSKLKPAKQPKKTTKEEYSPIIELGEAKDSKADIEADKERLRRLVEVNETVHQDYTGSTPATGYFASFVGLEDEMVELEEKEQVEKEEVRIPLFSDFSQTELDKVIARFAKMLVPSGKIICQQGDVGNSLYVIVSGVVEVARIDDSGDRIVLSNLKAGDFFGEFGLLADGKRHATVTALKASELLEITKRDFRLIAKEHPGVLEVLDCYYRERIVDNLLAQAKLFRNFDLNQRKRFVSALKLKRIGESVEVIREGDKSGDLFFIKSGRFNVVLERNNRQMIIAQLGPGDFFGEIALATGEARTATVQAKTKAEVLMLPEADARSILESDPDIRSKFEAAVVERAEKAGVQNLYYKMLKSNISLV